MCAVNPVIHVNPEVKRFQIKVIRFRSEELTKLNVLKEKIQFKKVIRFKKRKWLGFKVKNSRKLNVKRENSILW